MTFTDYTARKATEVGGTLVLGIVFVSLIGAIGAFYALIYFSTKQ